MVLTIPYVLYFLASIYDDSTFNAFSLFFGKSIDRRTGSSTRLLLTEGKQI